MDSINQVNNNDDSIENKINKEKLFNNTNQLEIKNYANYGLSTQYINKESFMKINNNSTDRNNMRSILLKSFDNVDKIGLEAKHHDKNSSKN
jgi:hypothetical protein